MAQSTETQSTAQQGMDQQNTVQIPNTDTESQGTTQQNVNPQSMGQNQTNTSDADMNGSTDRRWANVNDSDRHSRRRAQEERDELTHALQQQN